jgi:hypothetical protein
MSKLLVSVLGVVEPVLAGDPRSPSLIGEGDVAVTFSVLVMASLIVLKPPNLGLLVKNAILLVVGLEDCFSGSRKDCSYSPSFVTIGLIASFGDSCSGFPS